MLDGIRYPKDLDAFCILSDELIAWPDLYILALKMAGWFEENHVGCLAFCVPNGLSNLLAYLGGWAADITLMPMNPRLKSAEVIRMVQQYHPTHLWVSSEKINEELTNICRNLSIQLFVVRDVLLQYSKRAEAPSHSENRGGQTVRCLDEEWLRQAPLLFPKKIPQQSIIHFTSGTLGENKGAMHSHQQCAIYARMIARDLLYQKDDCLLICLSLNHAMAFSYQLLPALYLGLSCVFLPSFEIQSVLLSLLPTMAYLLAKEVQDSGQRYPHLRQIIIAGDALPIAMRELIVAAFGFEPIVGIGMTESFGYCLNPHPEKKQGASGIPVAGYSFRVVDDRFQDLPVGETGEILVQGPGLFTEYYQLPELTEASFYKGWFKTGDLGAIDGDGYLWFRGRRKHLIISGGSNIAPLEVEAAMYEHPDILEAVVLGAPHPNEIEIVIAVIATMADAALTEQQLKQFLSTRLADYKLPKHIYFLKSLPKNATGKIDRAMLAEHAKRGIWPFLVTRHFSHRSECSAPNLSPMMMGICNITYDSFTEVGKGPKTTSLCFQEIQKMVLAKAHIVDIGAESTGKEAKGLDAVEELHLLERILDELAHKKDSLAYLPLISIDTRKISVMKALLEKYPFIWMINDVEGSDLDEKAKLVTHYGVKYVLTHHLGVIGRTAYLSKERAVEIVVSFFKKKVAVLKKHGVHESQIYLDMGFGYGKDHETTQILLQNFRAMKSQLQLPFLMGHSRKPSALGLSKQATLAELDAATEALSSWLSQQGADILRVHKI
jgi:dihydropteroate synthase